MTTRPADEEILVLIDNVSIYAAMAAAFSGNKSASYRNKLEKAKQALRDVWLAERQAARDGVTDEMVERVCQHFFVGNVRKPWPWRETQDMDEPDAVFASMRAALESITQPARGEVVVTKNEAGQIVAVTRQDEDGRVLEVIAEPTARPVVVTDKKIEEALDIFYGSIHWRCFGKKSLEGANGVKERMRDAIESVVHTVSIPDALGHSRSMVDSQYVEGWNACREAMLSASPHPQQAVPDGWIDCMRRALKALERGSNDTLDGRNAADEIRAMLSTVPTYNGKKEG